MNSATNQIIAKWYFTQFDLNNDNKISWNEFSKIDLPDTSKQEIFTDLTKMSGTSTFDHTTLMNYLSKKNLPSANDSPNVLSDNDLFITYLYYCYGLMQQMWNNLSFSYVDPANTNIRDLGFDINILSKTYDNVLPLKFTIKVGDKTSVEQSAFIKHPFTNQFTNKYELIIGLNIGSNNTQNYPNLLSIFLKENNISTTEYTINTQQISDVFYIHIITSNADMIRFAKTMEIALSIIQNIGFTYANYSIGKKSLYDVKLSDLICETRTVFNGLFDLHAISKLIINNAMQYDTNSDTPVANIATILFNGCFAQNIDVKQYAMAVDPAPDPISILSQKIASLSADKTFINLINKLMDALLNKTDTSQIYGDINDLIISNYMFGNKDDINIFQSNFYNYKNSVAVGVSYIDKLNYYRGSEFATTLRSSTGLLDELNSFGNIGISSSIGTSGINFNIAMFLYKYVLYLDSVTLKFGDIYMQISTSGYTFDQLLKGIQNIVLN